MKITGFDISDFKGIRNAKIRFAENDVARVHTLVGLNESGKTTLLEALHSFSPDAETELVVRNVTNAQEQREQWVPRDKISTFTGNVSVTAYVHASTDDLSKVGKDFSRRAELQLEDGVLTEKFTVSLIHKYKNGDFIESERAVDLKNIRAKTKRAQYFRPLKGKALNVLKEVIECNLPVVAYYPTFVFDFPERIYLTNRDNSPKNQFYKQLFQDILDFDGNGYTIQDSILNRLHKEETRGYWETWFSSFVGTTEEDKVKQVIARAERAVTRVIFSKWNEVFGETVGAKQIVIDLQYEKGKLVENEDGSEEEPEIHDAYIRFRIKDGVNVYSVDDRSLGFRWFFSFLLFTQFRIHREQQRPTIFLFDEPASNLHAAAQKKLLESFPAIAEPPHRLIYSTHSHYMVEPKWLEQAYIVYDQSSTPDESIIDGSVHKDEAVDVQVVPYRQFVQTHPEQTSYFQPILDTLRVQPSKFDYAVGGLIVEGKSDYYFVRFFEMCTNVDIGSVFPARGSGTMGALVSLHRGWGLPIRILFDADRGGADGKKNLRTFALNESEVTTLAQLDPSISVIEDVFTDKNRDQLTGGATQKAKAALLRHAQECVASEKVPQLQEATLKRMKRVLSGLSSFISDE